jgi:hypothetical protein
MQWGDSDITPAPLRRPCASCGRATPYLDELNLCDVCRFEHDADMREIDALERADEDYAARRSFYNG